MEGCRGHWWGQRLVFLPASVGTPWMVRQTCWWSWTAPRTQAPPVLTDRRGVGLWRVERLEQGRLLLLRAEMRLPGLAWLELQVTPDGDGPATVSEQSSSPKGFRGGYIGFQYCPFTDLSSKAWPIASPPRPV